ncbi:M48 family metalloprotease [Planktothrix agardhii]|uniref:M48 family metalloprotease n=1 Tax=Planktothrix agardhii TaxID=1160 RepID=UPI001D0A96C5|nr:M48 family metalloprotease [Planktothrix agardhii]MCB8786796.1 M48 family metalloprotease [Planktothrix agardhii 1025]
MKSFLPRSGVPSPPSPPCTGGLGGLFPLPCYINLIVRNAQQAAILAQAVNQLVNLKYGRKDELESDRLGFEFMTKAGYSPKGLVELMQILGSANSGGSPPEFLSTHPNPGNGVELLQAIITKTYPQGIPRNLEEGQERFAQAVLTNHSKN